MLSANARKYWYLFTGLVAAVVPIMIQIGVFDSGQGENFEQIVITVGSILGAGGALTASNMVHRQQKEGLHDPPLNPIDQVLESIPQVLDQAATANANVDKLREVTGGLLEGLQAVQPSTDLASQVLGKL